MWCCQGNSPTLRCWEWVTCILYPEHEFRRPVHKWLSQSNIILFLFAWRCVSQHATILSYHILKENIVNMALVNILHATWCAEQLCALWRCCLCSSCSSDRALPLPLQAVVILPFPLSFIPAHFTSASYSFSIFKLVLLLLSNFHLRWWRAHCR